MASKPFARSAHASGLITSVLAAALFSAHVAQAQTPAPGARPAGPGGQMAAVTVVEAQTQSVPLQFEASGLTQAIDSVIIRPQVNAVIDRIVVNEGQNVAKGDLLFVLDSHAAQADWAKMKAQAAKSKATLADVQRQLKRSEELFAQQFVSQGALDTLKAQLAAQEAQVAADEAAAASSEVQLGYYQIRAPFPGRIGAIDVSTGMLVNTGSSSTALLTLTRFDPMEVQFRMPETLLPRILKAGVGAPVTVRVQGPAGDPIAPIQGKVTLIDNQVDSATGSILIKATFNNSAKGFASKPAGAGGAGKGPAVRGGKPADTSSGTPAWPGQMAFVTLQAGTAKDVFVIPQASLNIQGDKRSVFVVGPENKAVVKPVRIQQTLGEQVAVSGLTVGDQVVVMGRNNVRPGMTVRVVRAPGQEPAVTPATPSGNASAGTPPVDKEASHAAPSGKPQ